MLTKTIASICGEDIISREAGEKVRIVCELCIKNGQALTLDFQHNIVASTSFFHEAFIKLFQQGVSLKEFEQLIILKDIDKRDKKLLETLRLSCYTVPTQYPHGAKIRR